jgi:hypothetical protein
MSVLHLDFHLVTSRSMTLPKALACTPSIAQPPLGLRLTAKRPWIRLTSCRLFVKTLGSIF